MIKVIKVYRLIVEDLWDGARQYPNADTFYSSKASAEKAAAKWIKKYPDSLVEEGETKEKVLRTYVNVHEIVINGGDVD